MQNYLIWGGVAVVMAALIWAFWPKRDYVESTSWDGLYDDPVPAKPVDAEPALNEDIYAEAAIVAAKPVAKKRKVGKAKVLAKGYGKVKKAKAKR